MLDDCRSRSQRALEWIHHDRKDYWAEELRRSWEGLSPARIQLQQAQVSRRIAGHEPACIDEKRALERAKRRLETAEQKVQAVKQWTQRHRTGRRRVSAEPDPICHLARHRFGAGRRRAEAHERLFGKLYFPGGAGGCRDHPRPGRLRFGAAAAMPAEADAEDSPAAAADIEKKEPGP